jgi:hypothetical protein
VDKSVQYTIISKWTLSAVCLGVSSNMEERGERKREEEEEEEQRFGREEQLSEDRVRIRNIQSSANTF